MIIHSNRGAQQQKRTTRHLLPFNIPQGLRQYPHWVAWRLEKRRDKLTKIPYNPKSGRQAQVNDPTTWSSFDLAYTAHLQGQYTGIGFVFSDHDPFCGIDFDGCVKEGVIVDPTVADYVRKLDTYAEFSQSGSGVHCIATASLPGQGRNDRDHRCEMYDHLRFFVVTGNHVPGTPATSNARQDEVAALYNELFPAIEKVQPIQHNHGTAISQDDRSLLERMFASRNGAKIEALWGGDLAGYASQSDADLAMCNHLAFWTGNDVERIDRLFRQSGLFRDKWDRPARNGETYGQGTIRRGLVSIAYTGEGRRKPVAPVSVGVL